MEYEFLDDLRIIQSGLQRRQWLSSIIDSILYGASTTTIAMFLACSGFIPPWATIIAGICTSIMLLILYSCKPKVSLADTGIYLDRGFALKERMSAAVATETTKSIFSKALLHDAEEYMHSITNAPLLQSIIPARTSYLVLPTATIIATLLLTPVLSPQEQTNQSQVLTAIPFSSTSSQINTISENKLQQLLSKLRKANAHLNKNNNAENRAMVQRLQQELYHELAHLRQANQTTGKSYNLTNQSIGKTGQIPRELQIKTTTSTHIVKTRKNEKSIAMNIVNGPAWTALSVTEATIPAGMRVKVRNYMNAIVQDIIVE